ncbi:proton-conducting transporter transmembrane domain-containing protein [Stagnihabitans tardus]|uniref:Probable inorganic carbon transporter subunit DabB n=1 Tax=Stagnihabitans tardus TaxID=2699202 RepID=A0AAE4Y5D7_9RHOB|nr:proton-conducting transporter membrane subunit [Stagnihabitans tardus]NBZ86023.1 oxidoreductase [Stagnihabitans tardus]
MENLPLPALAPLILAVAAWGLMRRPGRRPGALPLVAEIAGLASLTLGLAGLGQLVLRGPLELAPFGIALMRLDAISGALSVLVGFTGWIVLRFARRAMDGEAREGRFHALTLAAIASVMVVIQAANLPLVLAGFVALALVLRQLLLFYPERPEAQRAAAKFIRVWAAGDVALAMAIGLLGLGTGTVEIAGLNRVAELEGAAVPGLWLLALAAVLKTASFPLHGWLTEVMEAPTPVSALLHAGIIAAGGFMLISLAGLVQQSPGVMAALVILGGFTALFGALVMLTQSAVKTALAWSTVAQMGFMLLQCGLGLWALALLHILAHALYKAHAFLASGGAVQTVAAQRKPGPVAVPGLRAVAQSFGLALGLYLVVATGFAVLAGEKSPQALALGAMLIFGVSYLIAQGMADAAPGALTRRTLAASFAAALAYFGFQVLAEMLWGPVLPPAPQVGALEGALIVLAVLSFGLVAFAQALFPLWAHHPSTAGLRVHLANGLYLNALLDRLIGGFRSPMKS